MGLFSCIALAGRGIPAIPLDGALILQEPRGTLPYPDHVAPKSLHPGQLQEGPVRLERAALFREQFNRISRLDPSGAGLRNACGVCPLPVRVPRPVGMADPHPHGAPASDGGIDRASLRLPWLL